MAEENPEYVIPPLATGRLIHDGLDERGSLLHLLGIYEGLSPFGKKKASILLDQRIDLPPSFGCVSRAGRLNLFDGEIAGLLPYYRAAKAAGTAPD